ncbi:hypothetical protein JCM10212_007127 [Sporobolomyces blumeae]
MNPTLGRSNTTTTNSSFWFPPIRNPARGSNELLQPAEPPLHSRHVDEPEPSSSADLPLAFLKRVYPRSKAETRAALRASKVGLVEKMSSRERIERWHVEAEEERTSPLEKWRIAVAKAVEHERKQEELLEQAREVERLEATAQQQQQQQTLVRAPSMGTTTTILSATGELRAQFDQSSPFARSFRIEGLQPTSATKSDPHSSVVRATFLNDPRAAPEEHPYSDAFGFDASLFPNPPGHSPLGSYSPLDPNPPTATSSNLAVMPNAEETLKVPSTGSERSASPVDPAFASGSYQFPTSKQRHPLPPIDTNIPTSTVRSAFSSSPGSAPVVTTYQAFLPPPRSSSLPFADLASVHSTPPSPDSAVPSDVPPPVPPKCTAVPVDSFALLPPKAAALLGLIPSAHAPFAHNPHARPPRPPFARDRLNSLPSSETPSGSTEQGRSSFYEAYDGPQRPSFDSSTPTTLTTPSSTKIAAMSPLEQRANPIRLRPPPLDLTFGYHRQGMSSLPDLHASPSSSASAQPSSSTRGTHSFDSPRSGTGAATPRFAAAHHHPHSMHHSRTHTFAETEVESLLDAPYHAAAPPVPALPTPFSRTRQQGVTSASTAIWMLNGSRDLVRKLSSKKSFKDLIGRRGRQDATANGHESSGRSAFD